MNNDNNTIKRHRRFEFEKFRRDCVSELVGSTADNIWDTGNSPYGVSPNEVISYYIIRSQYCELDIEVVAQELSDMAEIIAEDHDNLSAEELELASCWNNHDVQFEAVDILRSLLVTA